MGFPANGRLLHGGLNWIFEVYRREYPGNPHLWEIY